MGRDRSKAVEPRASFYVSLNTDSKALAEQKAAAIWSEQIEVWEACLAGDSEEADNAMRQRNPSHR